MVASSCLMITIHQSPPIVLFYRASVIDIIKYKWIFEFGKINKNLFIVMSFIWLNSILNKLFLVLHLLALAVNLIMIRESNCINLRVPHATLSQKLLELLLCKCFFYSWHLVPSNTFSRWFDEKTPFSEIFRFTI